MGNNIDWDRLYQTQHSRLYSYFRARLSSSQQAEDFVASTFSQAWRKRHQYQVERGSEETWLYAIARNQLIDYLRRNRPAIIAIEDVSLQTDDHIEQTIEEREDLQTLNELIQKRLSERETHLLALKYAQQIPTCEIARMTGLSEANVAKIISRTLMKLRRFWAIDGFLAG